MEICVVLGDLVSFNNKRVLIYIAPYAWHQRRFLLTIYIALLSKELVAVQAGFRTRHITTVVIYSNN